MVVTVKTEGFKEFEQALEDLTTAAQKGVARRALIKAAKPLVDKAKAAAPVDEGHLKRSIAASDKLDGRQAKAHKALTGKQGAEVFVGPSYNIGEGGRHGHLVEFGTRHSAPKPFLRPTWAADQKQILDRISKEMWSEIEKAIARAERKAARQAAKL